MIKSAYFCSNWWQTRIVRNYFEILLVAVAYLVTPGHAQLGQYTLDINPKSSEGIFVTYFQVKGPIGLLYCIKASFVRSFKYLLKPRPNGPYKGQK